jgi:hypothetical protein
LLGQYRVKGQSPSLTLEGYIRPDGTGSFAAKGISGDADHNVGFAQAQTPISSQSPLNLKAPQVQEKGKALAVASSPLRSTNAARYTEGAVRPAMRSSTTMLRLHLRATQLSIQVTLSRAMWRQSVGSLRRKWQPSRAWIEN